MNELNNESLSFGYFGKLPQYADFIKHKAGAEEFSLLDDWLQKGIASAKIKFKSDWKSVYSKSPVYEFFFPVKKNESVIAGVLYPGLDKSGREFPFIIFSLLKKKSFNQKQNGSLPLKLNRFYYQAKQLFTIAANSTDVNSINTEFNKAAITLNTSSAIENLFEEYLSSTSVNELNDRIFARLENDSQSQGISFNADDENYNFDSGFLIQLSCMVNRDTDSLPFIFRTRIQDYNANIFIYSTQPDAEEFSKLITSETSNKLINQLTNFSNKHNSLKQYLEEQSLHSN